MDHAVELDELKRRLAAAEEQLRQKAEVEERLGLAVDIGQMAT